MKILVNILAVALISSATSAATIAIIDSGTDMMHEQIAPKAWINQLEIPGNNRDEDRNGYQDDVYGWNFAEGNNQVIDYKYLGTLNDDMVKFFELQEKSMRGTITQEEITWMRSIVQDEDFIKRMTVYGNFMHGTHVAGISAYKSDDAKILAVKLIPTEVKLPGQKVAINSFLGGFVEKLIKAGIDQLAKAQTSTFNEIAYYVADHGARVANGSFGTGYPQAKMIVETVMKTFSKKEPNPETVDKYAKYFLSALVKNSQSMLEAAPNTLFVFAAGNDGLDNDVYPTSPTNIQGDNEISVAATIDYDQLAPFSNYGEKMVDVAAPGVGILSSAPGNKYIKVSGTSQAAPYVAGVAGKVFDINPVLTPYEVKRIIMETVDVKSFLAGKVKTSGVVNSERAHRAAILSLSASVDHAIAAAKSEVLDMESPRFEKASNRPVYIKGSVLPLPSNFVISN
ncbi:peptidase, S8/S53 family [Bacteriovorax sp. BAL6_X]|uniref:S8 family serine peptidase n=1 Tax=Bacteriovorax sp. BAL6_X TaxID=1201290 RepID=UPI0003867C28|nr:S8 family serine peptidase [Bacteriovorax sp. BAL6_X]EPZ51453.1 peptidase, S8/S53 family [Bacteriovorax sp. BAL6_X]